MPAQQISNELTGVRPKQVFQVRDVAWLLFAAALIAFDPETNYNATIVLIFIGAFQIVEPRLRWFSSRRGQIVSVIVRMLLSYQLVGWSHGFDSVYYLIFLIPIISAATMYEYPGVIAVTAIASLSYFCFFLPVFLPLGYQVTPQQISVVCLRVSFFAIVAYVVYEQAKAKREEMVRTKEAAERLAESNLNLRRAEVSLRRSERLAALGQLTAGLAHEFRNPLGTIKASAEMLSKEKTRERPEVMAEMASYITSEVDRMNGLVSSFLDFARPLQTRPALGDLSAVVEDAIKQQAELAKSREVAVTFRPGEGPLSFVFDRDLLLSAISNLVQNAIQASAPGQEVEIRAEAKSSDVLIFVSDHGEGIQPQHLESIFNPFFTTKPQGVGLGLAIVAKIVDEHQGRINVFSEPGAGTRFEMILPKVQAS